MSRARIDPALRSVLDEFARSYLVKRRNALMGQDFEALRTLLADMKDRSLERNAELLDRFEAESRKRGSEVLRARDGDEANRMIADALLRQGAAKVAKSKSMVGEETRLNDYLAGRGIEPRETDLGEWIVQLEAEAPTHMVMPAIHLTRADVARIFARRLGRPVPDEIPALVRIAREELRREIFGIPAGFIGANALVAENGAVLLVTNEGNGRLVSTVPRVQVVLASIEKVVPTLADAALVLRLLPRNATGQVFSSYVSFIAGAGGRPRTIVLLDNHRSEILADPVFRQVLRCIKCSACLNVCPAYKILGGKEYAHVYMGGIGTLLTAWVHGLKASQEMAGLCLGCHRCEDYCAAKIKIADLVIALKERLNERQGGPVWKRVAFEGVLARPPLHRAAFAAARVARPLLAGRHGFLRRLPFPFGRYDRFRAVPLPAKKTFSRLFRTRRAGDGAPPEKGKVTIFAGCLVEHFYPEIGLDAVRVLRALGCGVDLAPAVCCGFPSANGGFSKAARKSYRRLIEAIRAADTVVTLCPTCTTMLGHAGPELTGEEAAGLAGKVVSFAEFIERRPKKDLTRILKPTPEPNVMTYHESCHHKYYLKAAAATRSVLEAATGAPIVDMPETATCCGFAGSFSVDQPEVSAALLEEKLDAVRETGADVVALDCPGCLL
ncbi:MAG: LUD domain-containing protein, partial [Candidatus Aminicenantes bacterium]|nr:LUD domain-containing protein [Candidatus Aminicenantes bacterium]